MRKPFIVERSVPSCRKLTVNFGFIFTFTSMKKGIKEIENQLAAIRRAKRYLTDIDRKIVVEQDRCTRLSILVQQEYADIERLKKQSFNRIFSRFFTEKENDLEKEKQEYLEAVLLYREAKKAEDLLYFERDVLLDKIAKEEALRKELQNLEKQERSENRARLAPQIRRHLRQKEENRRVVLQELEAVLELGADCLSKLESMQNLLHRMKMWIPLRRGSYLNRDLARQAGDLERMLLELRNNFIKYDTELRRISDLINLQTSIAHDDFRRQKLIFNLTQYIDRFTENFVKNLVSDFVMHTQMTRTQEFLLEIYHTVEQVQKDLRREEERIGSDDNFI